MLSEYEIHVNRMLKIRPKVRWMQGIQPVYQDFSENIDPRGHENHSGTCCSLGWHLPQNTAGLNWQLAIILEMYEKPTSPF